MKFEPVQQEIPQVQPLIKKRPDKKKPVSKKTQRWIVVVIFIFTILASAGFWLKTEIPKYWQKIATPTIISTLPKEKQFDPSPVLTEIGNLTQTLRGAYGVYVYELKTGRGYGVRQNEIFPAASLMKLPVMILTYQQAEAGKLNLTDYQELLRVMGQRSDNAAYNTLVKYFGKLQIQTLIDNLEMKKTSIATDDTSPVDIGLFFRKLYQGSLINRVNQEELLGFLTNTIFEDRIPAGVPLRIRVAHKIGTELGTFSDAGIIYTQEPFILVIMSKNAREAEANDVLPKISKAVWEFEDKN
jgi:beta-lactamase class A